MKPATWLKALAASYPRYEMSDLQADEYLLELRKWSLTDDEWISVRSLAKRRYTFFPTYAELDEIMHEVKRNERVNTSATPCWETYTGADGRVYARRPLPKAG